eukprot:3939071-Rhodomonas_salina.3
MRDSVMLPATGAAGFAGPALHVSAVSMSPPLQLHPSLTCEQLLMHPCVAPLSSQTSVPSRFPFPQIWHVLRPAAFSTQVAPVSRPQLPSHPWFMLFPEPESQASDPALMPSPHVVTQFVVRAPAPVVHAHPRSSLQRLEHPSPSVFPPSSHPSFLSWAPSPQPPSQTSGVVPSHEKPTTLVQLWQPVVFPVGPTSHSSAPCRLPSPQTDAVRIDTLLALHSVHPTLVRAATWKTQAEYVGRLTSRTSHFPSLRSAAVPSTFSHADVPLSVRIRWTAYACTYARDVAGALFQSRGSQTTVRKDEPVVVVSWNGVFGAGAWTSKIVTRAEALISVAFSGLERVTWNERSVGVCPATLMIGIVMSAVSWCWAKVTVPLTSVKCTPACAEPASVPTEIAYSTETGSNVLIVLRIWIFPLPTFSSRVVS